MKFGILKNALFLVVVGTVLLICVLVYNKTRLPDDPYERRLAILTRVESETTSDGRSGYQEEEELNGDIEIVKQVSHYNTSEWNYIKAKRGSEIQIIQKQVNDSCKNVCVRFVDGNNVILERTFENSRIDRRTYTNGSERIFVEYGIIIVSQPYNSDKCDVIIDYL